MTLFVWPVAHIMQKTKQNKIHILYLKWLFVLQIVAVVFYYTLAIHCYFLLRWFLMFLIVMLFWHTVLVKCTKDYVVFFPTLCLHPHSCRGGMCSAWAETAGSRLFAQQQDCGALHESGEELCSR